MRPVRPWIALAATVGLCLTGIGCGGSKSDDAADSSTVGEAPPPSEAAPEPAGKGQQALARNDAPAPEAPAAAPADDKPAVTAKGDASGTTELLNLANSSSPAAEPGKGEPAAGGPPASGPGETQGPAARGMPGGPGAGGMPAGYPGMAGGSAAQSGYASQAGGPGGAPAGYPGAAGGPGSQSAYASQAGGPGGPRGGPAGGEGMNMMPGGPGAGGMDGNGPADFRTPVGGATAFLKAVRSKDRRALVEATALRSPNEASTERMKKMFATITDESFSDDTLNELAKALEGYQIVGSNDPKSSGKLGIILEKPNGRSGLLRRTITVRREAKGWKVLDISGQGEVDGPRSGSTARRPR